MKLMNQYDLKQFKIDSFIFFKCFHEYKNMLNLKNDEKKSNSLIKHLLIS